MRVGTMIRFTPSNDPNDRLLDRVADYARRKGWTLKQAEKWLAPNLGYEPED